MRERFLAHNRFVLDGDRCQGYAVAIVGTKRSSYIAFLGGFTYDEAEARIFTHSEACLACANVPRELFRYSLVVAVDGMTEHIKGGMLPTVDGY